MRNNTTPLLRLSLCIGPWLCFFPFLSCNDPTPPQCNGDSGLQCEAGFFCQGAVCKPSERTPESLQNPREELSPDGVRESLPDHPREPRLEPPPEALSESSNDALRDSPPESVTENERDRTPETSEPPLCSLRMEICDGQDNDCDGKIDETFPQQNQPCSLPCSPPICHPGGGTYVCDKGRLRCLPPLVVDR